LFDMDGQLVLKNLHQLTLSLGTTLDLDHESAAFMQWLAQVIRPELAALFLVDDKREHLDLVQTLGFKAEHLRLELGLDPWQWLRQQGVDISPPGDPGCFALPITLEGELLGLLAFVSRGHGMKREAEIFLIEVAAGFFALHLRNIYRHHHVEQLVEQRTAELRASEERHYALFEESPVALLEADFSQVKEELDRLRAQGVEELRPFLRSHPQLIAEWAEKIRLLKVNKAALRLFGCNSPNELFSFGRKASLKTLLKKLREAFVLLYRGERRFEQEVSLQLRRGDSRHLVMQVAVLPAYAATWGQVLVSVLDVTELVRARQELELSHGRLQRVLEGSVRSLAALAERRDPYTAGHQERVAELACAIAAELNLPQEQIQGLRVAALLHDIGKIAVPAEILSKPARPSELEFAMIKSHPQVGYEVLAGIDFPWPVAEIVHQHHERLDGSGYPQGLKGEEILLEAQILAVADVVEAMASHRPYRPAHTLEETLEEIKTHQGVLYRSDVVAACVRLFSAKQPPSSKAWPDWGSKS